MGSISAFAFSSWAAVAHAQTPPSAQFPPEQAAPASVAPEQPKPAEPPAPPPAQVESVAPPALNPAQAEPPRSAPPKAAGASNVAPRSRVVPGWNVGGGLRGAEGYGVQASDAIAPMYSAVIERRLGRTTWLALSGAAGYSATDVPVSDSTDDPNARDQIEVRTASVAVLLGARQVLVKGVVDLSLTFGAFIAHESIGGDALRPTESTGLFWRPGTTSRTVGLLAGIALERELVEALSLRLSLDVASATWSKFTYLDFDELDRRQERKEDEKQIRLSLRPGLAVHFYF
jgi:hypothetical protein